LGSVWEKSREKLPERRSLSAQQAAKPVVRVTGRPQFMSNPGHRSILVSAEANKALVRRYYEQLWNRWDFALVEEIIAADIALRGSLGIEVRGREGFQQYMRTVRAAFPDFQNQIQELVAEGDKVVARLAYRGTHQGELFGIRATGKPVTYAGVAIFRIANGKILEGWVLGDTLGLLHQLGASSLPQATTPEKKSGLTHKGD